jgi:3-oxoadipate enol-lactonase
MCRLLAHSVEGRADAPAVVLLHPIATHSAIWAPQVAAWSAAFRLVRIDLPGHGASAPAEGSPTLADYAAEVHAVLGALEIERAAIVGLSLGGMVAQAFAVAYPRQVRALVLAHTSARTDDAVRELWSRRLALFEEQGLEAQVAPTLERWFTRSFAAASPMTMSWLAQQIRATSSAGYRAAVQAIQRLDHLDRLKEIAAPALVVAGAADSAVPPAAASLLAASIPGAKLVVLDDAAHIGNVQQPVAFTETVGSFLLDALNEEEPS